jgi:hypothetical protein
MSHHNETKYPANPEHTWQSFITATHRLLFRQIIHQKTFLLFFTITFQVRACLNIVFLTEKHRFLSQARRILQT